MAKAKAASGGPAAGRFEVVSTGEGTVELSVWTTKGAEPCVLTLLPARARGLAEMLEAAASLETEVGR